ncbi:MAG: MotA/TolQ/ExbB proton channel family protein [Giesbergeria sp.]
MDPLLWWRNGDAVTQTAALVLLCMSVASWVLMLWKLRMLQRAARDVARSVAAFWQVRGWDDAPMAVAGFDRELLVLPLVQAALQARATAPAAPTNNASIHANALSRATRLLRGALLASVGRLQYGQVLLATVGATAPFVGLLGTVWGIYHALTALAGSGQISVEQLAGPVGEALIMTAAGLAVAIPAVLGYNLLGRQVGRLEAELEGFAHDLRELCTTGAQVP